MAGAPVPVFVSLFPSWPVPKPSSFLHRNLADLPVLHRSLSVLPVAPVQVDEGATHTEAAWAWRLPSALSFLLAPWWADIEARHTDSLFFTSPRKLQAGQPAVLFVNKSKSHILAGHKGPLQVPEA